MFSRRTAWNLSPNRYSEALDTHRQAGREVLDLTASNPTTVGLDYRENELLRSLTPRGALAYEPSPKGLRSAREAILEYYAEKGNPFTADNLVLTTGTSEAYSFVFRLLCDPGDAVFVPVPSYPLFDFLADLNDITLVRYELVYDHRWQIDFPSMLAAIERTEATGKRCRAVLVVHPNNPTGSYVKPGEAAELTNICDATEMAIIADEVFLDYALTDHESVTFSSSNATLTFTLSGLSKICALPQMKVAWIAVSGPPPIKAEALARLEVIADTYLSMSAPMQLAIPTMLAERQHMQDQLLSRTRGNLAFLDEQLAGQDLCLRLTVEGGWYVVLRVPVLGTDEDLAIDLLRNRGVLLQPGHFYNFPREGHLIASLVTPCGEFAEGIVRTLRYIASRR